MRQICEQEDTVTFLPFGTTVDIHPDVSPDNLFVKLLEMENPTQVTQSFWFISTLMLNINKLEGC